MDIVVSSDVDSQARSVISVTGAIDLATRSQVHEAGQTGLDRDGATGLVLDLSGVSFIDSTGIGVLVELAGDARDRNQTFLIRQPSDRVVRILEVTGLLNEWEIEPA